MFYSDVLAFCWWLFQDVNDHPPVFTQNGRYEQTISEETPPSKWFVSKLTCGPVVIFESLRHQTLCQENPVVNPVAAKIREMLFFPYCLSSVSCIYEYLVVDSGGYVCEEIIFVQELRHGIKEKLRVLLQWTGQLGR